MTTTTTSSSSASSASSSSSSSSSSSASEPWIAPSDLAIGMDVDVASRTWAGINKPGGHATITSTRVDERTGAVDRVDVKYVLGGRERDVELIYVRRHVELTRGDRGRRGAERMNAASLGEVVLLHDDGGGAKTKKR
ncbi:hypothetical protein ACHAW5_008551 [Stephanodiscus triporus]|uniref:Uncharacterized protein n=1 Tax=Stephanodiscus triporus TaxID=2934178 RepID=A0ABD3NK21_9STRA